MQTEILFIKNMVCHRCILAVEDIVHNLDIASYRIRTGEIHLLENLQAGKRVLLAGQLNRIGLEIIDNRVSSLVEKIKHAVIKKARNEVAEKEIKLKLSAYLSQQLHHEYTYLSSLFSSIEGRTIENYYIEQRIEKVKELLVYKEMSLSEIAFEMEYSSVAHLSNQFKKITGLTASHFKKVGSHKRTLLDHI
ncbi:MAG: helix-turn-helix domain-containing protein [Ferruginibacter sp.]